VRTMKWEYSPVDRILYQCSVQQKADKLAIKVMRWLDSLFAASRYL